MNQFLISAARKSSGKTLVSVGLAAAYHMRGTNIATFKKGPDYIDPIWLSAASNKPCWNLDFYTMSRDEITEIFHKNSCGSKVVIVEGNKGLYDGLDPEGSDSNAALSKLLKLPVIMVVDGDGTTRGIAPLLKGYSEFDSEVNISGVILNKVASARHEAKLRSAVERYTDIPIIGAIYRDPNLVINERHIGLVPKNEDYKYSKIIKNIAKIINDSVDLDMLSDCTYKPRSESKQVYTSVDIARKFSFPRARVGIASDRVFSFYYPDDIKAFHDARIELVVINTLRDKRLPNIDGLFIGGGFPELFINDLNANVELRYSIKNFILRGGPTYAECGGLMYLSRSICYKSEVKPMVGIIPGDVVMTKRPIGRGYMKICSLPTHPWHRTKENLEYSYPAHEFHYSKIEGLPDTIQKVYSVRRGFGLDGSFDGIYMHNMLATYVHQRNTPLNPWVDAFVDFIIKNKSS